MNKRVLVVGGSKMYPGAVYLAAISAMRSGAASVLVMTLEKVAWIINTLSPDLVTMKLPGDFLTLDHLEVIKEKLETTDILVLGNGIGLESPTSELVSELVHWSGPKVIDADALKLLTDSTITNSILTPNKAEWELMQKQLDIETVLKNGNVIIQKDDPSMILSKEETTEVPVNKGLHKSGVGDVLAGLCAGYLAEGKTLYEAAFTATKTGNDVADVLTKEKKGYFFLASDIAEELKKVLSQD